MIKIGNAYTVLVIERKTILKYVLEKRIVRMSTGLKYVVSVTEYPSTSGEIHCIWSQ
jgi:hypothetical protein